MSMVYAIVLAGGNGERMGKNIPKQFLPLGKKSILRYTLDVFFSIDEIDLIIPVVHGDYIERVKSDIKGKISNKILKPVIGGKTRQNSSYNAIRATNYNSKDILLFHDAARPFIKPDMVLNTINAAREYGAVGTYVPAVDTIAVVESGYVKSTRPRKDICYTQTPQAFWYRIISAAHEKALNKGIINATDDISIVIDAGYEVRAIDGDTSNYKITNESDYQLARQLAEKN